MTAASHVPAVFGMNFQAVSVGKIFPRITKTERTAVPILHHKTTGRLSSTGWHANRLLAYGCKKTDDALWSSLRLSNSKHL